MGSTNPQTPTVTTEQLQALSDACQTAKQAIIDARREQQPYEHLAQLCDAYTAAMQRWYKARFPGRRFTKPTTAYLLRAL